MNKTIKTSPDHATSYSRNIAALSFGDLKTAALYFDRVVPVAFRSIQGNRSDLFLEAPDPVPVKVVTKLIFGDDGHELAYIIAARREL